MGSQATGPVTQWVRVELTAAGPRIRVLPGASAVPLTEVIAHVLSLGLTGVDYDAVAQAYRRADGEAAPMTRGASPAPPVERRTPPAPLPAVAARPPAVSADSCLVACAEAGLAAHITTTLSRCGVVVQEVASSGKAVDCIVRTRPDFVVLAPPLEEGNGLSVCRQVRATPEVGDTPILLIPEAPSRDAVIQGIRAGASDLMVKPVASATLLRKMTKALDGVGRPLSAAARRAVEAETAPTLAEEAEVKPLGKIDLARLVQKVERLLAMPVVVQRVLAITGNDRAGARDLATAVESDPAVTATILKRANSVAYGKTERSFDVKESIVRLGFSMTRSLVIGMSVFRMLPRGQRTVGFDRLEFWRHSLAAGIAARLLAPRAGIAETDTAFLAGLLHDIGKLILDEYCPSDFERATLIALKDLLPMREAERRELETDHSRVGAAVLRAWKFPEAIVDAVGRHHDVSERRQGVDAAQQRLGRLVQAANLLAKALGEGHGGDQLLQEMPAGFWEEAGLGGGLPTSFTRAFDDEVERSRDFLEVPPTEAAATEERTVLFLHEGLPPVSVLGLALERVGYRCVPITDPERAARFPEGAVQAGVVRASTSERLEAMVQGWRQTAALRAAPVLGVLPQGQRPPAGLPDGVTCLVEPYDRGELVRALP